MTTGYNHLVKYVTGYYHGIKTPFVMSFVQCTRRWKGFETSGNPESEPTLRVVIKVSNVFCFVTVCVIGSVSHFVLMHRDLVISTKYCIQMQKYSLVPRTSGTCLLVFGIRSRVMTEILLWDRLLYLCSTGIQDSHLFFTKLDFFSKHSIAQSL